MSDQPDIALTRRDFTPLLQQSCRQFVAAAVAAEGVLAVEPLPPDARASIDRSLVQMSLAVNRLVRLVLPPPEALEYFGLPRSILAHATLEPAIRVHDEAREGWDFRPWLSEKLTHLHNYLYAFMETSQDLLQVMSGESLSPDPAIAAESEDESGGPADRSTSFSSGIADPAGGSGGRENDPANAGDAPTLQERLLDRCLYELRAAKSYAEGILAAIDTMGLSVIDWQI